MMKSCVNKFENTVPIDNETFKNATFLTGKYESRQSGYVTPTSSLSNEEAFVTLTSEHHDPRVEVTNLESASRDPNNYIGSQGQLCVSNGFHAYVGMYFDIQTFSINFYCYYIRHWYTCGI